MNEAQRTAQNLARLELVDSSIRTQVRHVLGTLEYYGFKPLISSEVFRTPAEQLRLYRLGRSKVKWGFHCATTPDGKPGSLAADIIDAYKGWDASYKFWLTLGYAAKAQGLNWGGYFGLNSRQHGLLASYLPGIKTGVFPDANNIRFGWDVAHIETARVTIAEAKAGKR